MIVKRINTSDSRLLFGSDIHGEVSVLKKALHVLGFEDGKDNFVHAGDIIDRGSESLKTLDFFLRDKTDSYHTVLGNHDIFAIDNNDPTNCDVWIMNGGMWAFDELTQEERNHHAIMLADLPVAIEVIHNGYKLGVVHASVPEEFNSWDEFTECLEEGSPQLVQDATWDRTFIQHHKYHKDNHLSGVFATIHGHTPVKVPTMVGNRFHIDTGLVYGKYFTIVEFDKGDFEIYKFDMNGELIDER